MLNASFTDAVLLQEINQEHLWSCMFTLRTTGSYIKSKRHQHSKIQFAPRTLTAANCRNKYTCKCMTSWRQTCTTNTLKISQKHLFKYHVMCVSGHACISVVMVYSYLHANCMQRSFQTLYARASLKASTHGVLHTYPDTWLVGNPWVHTHTQANLIHPHAHLPCAGHIGLGVIFFSWLRLRGARLNAIPTLLQMA